MSNVDLYSAFVVKKTCNELNTLMLRK